MSDKNAATPTSGSPPSKAGEQAVPSRKAAGWTPRQRRTRKRILMIVGIAIIACGGLYAWQVMNSSPEVQGWEAYHRGDYRSAMSHFDAALRRNPRSADAYTGRSWVHVEQGEWEAALADSAEALRLAPDTTLAYTARANALAGKGQVKEAVAELDKALEHNPRYARAYYDRARFRYARSPETAAPLADLDEAIRLKPDFSLALSLRGWIYWKSARYADAIDSCTRALAIDQGDALAYYYRGLAREALGQQRAGAADLERALQLDPNLRSRVEGQPRGQRQKR
jgi:tetratricopeptide (TPR) repeat protein